MINNVYFVTQMMLSCCQKDWKVWNLLWCLLTNVTKKHCRWNR